MSNPLDTVTAAVAALAKALPDLLEACTDPDATDMAELLLDVQTARIALQAVERDTELACAKAMTADEVATGTLRVERRRSADRKAWDHAAWQGDVRRQIMRANGLAGAQGVIDAAGEVLPGEVLAQLMADLQNVHGAAAPKTTALKGLGLDARDYCESSPGAWHVRVQRMVDESAETEVA